MGLPMFTAYVVVTLLAVAANAFSGVAALVHFKPILPGMVKAGVPESWLTFPIGTLKLAGAVGLLLGLIGVPLIGTPPQSASSCSSSGPSTPTCAHATSRRSSAWRSGFSCWPWPRWYWDWPHERTSLARRCGKRPSGCVPGRR
jgi:hypothetical protein